MKITSLLPSAAGAALLAVAFFAGTSSAQAPQTQPAAGQPASTTPQEPPVPGMGPGGRGPRSFPAPTNLQVLPKDTTGQQVHDIMQNWAGSLGVHCDTCHVTDPTHPGPNGRPSLKPADDTKPQKQIARLMYTMTQQLNQDPIRKAVDLDKEDMGSPVTCGTCHRGHKMPEEYVIPPEENPGGPGAPPQGGAAPPAK